MFSSNDDVTVGISVISNNAGMTSQEAAEYITRNKGIIQLWGNVEIEEDEGYYDSIGNEWVTTKFIETTIYGTIIYEGGTEIETRITAKYDEGLTYLLAGAGMMDKTIKDYTIELDEAEAGETVESGYLTFREIV